MQRLVQHRIPNLLLVLALEQASPRSQAPQNNAHTPPKRAFEHTEAETFLGAPISSECRWMSIDDLRGHVCHGATQFARANASGMLQSEALGEGTCLGSDM